MYFEKQHFYRSSAWLLINTFNAKNKTENPCNRRLKCTNTWSKRPKQKHVTTADSFLFLTLKALNELGKPVCCEHISEHSDVYMLYFTYYIYGTATAFSLVFSFSWQSDFTLNFKGKSLFPSQYFPSQLSSIKYMKSYIFHSVDEEL